MKAWMVAAFDRRGRCVCRKRVEAETVAEAWTKFVNENPRYAGLDVRVEGEAK